MSKDVRVSDATMNFGLFGIKPTTDVVPEAATIHQPAEESANVGDTFVMLDGITSEKAAVVPSLHPSATSITGPLFGDPEMESFTGKLTETEPQKKFMFIPGNMTVTNYVDMIHKFADENVRILEENADRIGLSTNQLFDAGLKPAIKASLYSLLHIMPNGTSEAEGFTMPSISEISDDEQNYVLFAAMFEYPELKISEIKVKFDIPGFSEQWEMILDMSVAKLTKLDVDDALNVTGLLSETWCEECDHDDDDACCGGDEDGDEDDDEDTIDGIDIGLSLDTAQPCGDTHFDTITVTGCDGIETNFFIDYQAIIDRASLETGNAALNWLSHMEPALIFDTDEPGIFVAINDVTGIDLKIMPLQTAICEDSSMTRMGLYLFQPGTFQVGESSNEMIGVLNKLFAENIAGTALSQLPEIVRRSQFNTVPVEDVIAMLDANGIDICSHTVKNDPVAVNVEISINAQVTGTEPTLNGHTYPTVDVDPTVCPGGTITTCADTTEEGGDEEAGCCDNGDEPAAEAPVNADELSELGRSAAEALRAATKIPTDLPTPEEPAEEGDEGDEGGMAGDLVMKPFRKK